MVLDCKWAGGRFLALQLLEKAAYQVKGISNPYVDEHHDVFCF